MSQDSNISENTALKLFDTLGEKIASNTEATKELVSKSSELIAILKEQPKSSDIVMLMENNLKQIHDIKMETFLKVESSSKLIGDVKCDTGYMRDKLQYLISRVAYLTITIAVLSSVFVGSYLVVKEGLEDRLLKKISDEIISLQSIEDVNRNSKLLGDCK